MATDRERTIYTQVGGAEGITVVVNGFYSRLLNDPAVAPYFADVDLGSLHAHQVSFLSAAMGGPKRYDGRALADAHASIDIPIEAFDRVLDHLVDALGEAGVALDVIERVVDTLSSLEPEIAGRR